MAQLINLTSEALQATIRRLLPSQQGFGEDLQATNVVTPIIDLTPTAEGTQIPQYLQQALAFGSQTSFSASAGSVDLASSAGFWRVTGNVTLVGPSVAADIKINDGSTNKTVVSYTMPSTVTAGLVQQTPLDYVFYLKPGHKIIASADANQILAGSYRQVATATGELVNPSGFTFE